MTRQRALGTGVDEHVAIFEVARSLWRANWQGEPLRLLGVSASALERRGEGEQTELFASDERSRTLQAALDKVRDKLGEASVVPAGSLIHRRTLGQVPFGAVRKPIDPALSREGTSAQAKRVLRRDAWSASPPAPPPPASEGDEA